MKNISKNKFFEIIFEKIINDVNINVDLFRDKKIANDVDNAIITFDVSIDMMIVRFAIIVFDINENINNAI